jgi:hypothetical protein
MDPVNIGLALVAAVSGLAGIASARAAARATRYTADASTTNTKATAEIEAFARARAMDDRTIVRQNEEINDLTNDNRELRIRLQEAAKEKLTWEVQKRALMDQNNDLRNRLRSNNEK